MDFREHTVEDLAAQVGRKEISARELTQAALDRIGALDGQVHAFLSVDGDLALADAGLVDDSIAAGDDVPPLAGIPVGVKDLEDAKGFVTTHGSVIAADDAPSAVDSLLVARLKAAGCVVVGKTNTPEFGCKGDTTNGLGPPTLNPWDMKSSAGGSSGGSAAAVAAGMVPLATASDGGGSIRIPAAACGLTGFKPSLGRIPDGGVTPPSWADLSVKGPLTLRAADAAAALDTVVAPDPRDLRSLPKPRNPWRPQLDDPHPPYRVAWSPTLGYGTVDPGVAEVCRAAVDRLADSGCEIVDHPVVFPQDPVRSWLTITSAAHLRTVAEFIGTPEFDKLDPAVKFSVNLAEKFGPTDVIVAQDAAYQLNQALATALQDVSFLICPVIAGRLPLPWGQGRIEGVDDPNWVQFTYPFNLTRSPAGTVFVGCTDDGLPVGLQVVGAQHADAGVLRMLAYLEQAVGSDHASERRLRHRGSVGTVAPPHAPWALRGEALVCLTRKRPRLAMPDGIGPAPGPTAVAAVRYTDSPVGPYLQLMVLVPGRLGAHLGWSAVLAVVDKPDALVALQMNWGMPAEVGELRWFARDGIRQLLWEDRDLSVKAHGRGFGIPMVVPHRQVQARADGPVVVPDRLWGLFRPALVTIEGSPRDALDVVIGRHPGATVDGVHQTIAPARTPVGLLAPLRPATAEPLMRQTDPQG